MLNLGINYSQMHDSSACIVRDGELLFAVAEERISRLKHDARFPQLAIQACLDFAKVPSAQVDEVCFGWQPAGPVYRHDLKLYASGKWPVSYMNLLNSSRHFLRMWHQESGAAPFRRIFGTGKAGKPRFGKVGHIEHVLTLNWPDSLGLFYAEFTGFLGFVPNSDEWKVMGLAPYGQPGIDLSAYINPNDAPYRVFTRNLIGDSVGYSHFASRLGAPREAESDISEQHKNIAFAVQDACEEAMMSVVKLALEKTKSKNLCLAGGVALNSKANGKIAASGKIDNIFVQPAASDDGVALGAALAPYLDGNGRLPNKPMRHGYWGPAFEDDAIEKTLVTYKIRHTKLSDPAIAAAQLLSAGKILGWFQGRMEFGPRALGSRSILADPRDPEMNAKVNNAVKFREWWRPFAPSLKKEAAAEYLESAYDSPFMILTAQVRTEKRGVIPSVTHVDGSARPQTVEREVSPLYYRLIDEFGKITGVPVIMNTSFNLRGEAIVHTPTDALRTFFSSGMDALVIGSFLVEK